MPPKKDDGAALKQLKKSLKENTLGALYLLHGEGLICVTFTLARSKSAS